MHTGEAGTETWCSLDASGGADARASTTLHWSLSAWRHLCTHGHRTQALREGGVPGCRQDGKSTRARGRNNTVKVFGFLIPAGQVFKRACTK